MFGRKRNKEQKESKLQDKLAGKIVGAGIKLQTKFADRMNKIFSGMNTTKLKHLLIIFCLGCGGYSIYL